MHVYNVIDRGIYPPEEILTRNSTGHMWLNTAQSLYRSGVAQRVPGS